MNSQGFGLINVLVTTGILGVLAVVSMGLSNINQKSTNHTASRMEEIELTNRARLVLQNGDACLKTFENVVAPDSVSEVAIGPIKDHTGRHIIDPATYSSSNLKISAIRVKNPFDVMASTRGLVFLELTFARSKKTFGYHEMKHEIMLDVSLDQNMQVRKCYNDSDRSIASARKSICEEMGGEVTVTPQPNGVDLVSCQYKFDMYKGMHSQKQCMGIGGLPQKLNITNPDGTVEDAYLCKIKVDDPKFAERLSGWNYASNWSEVQAVSANCKSPASSDVNITANNFSTMLSFATGSGGTPLGAPINFATGTLVGGCSSLPGHSWSDKAIPAPCSYTCRYNYAGMPGTTTRTRSLSPKIVYKGLF